MNYKIICDDRDIEFTNNYPALTFSYDINKNFYRVNDDIIEVDYLNFDDINERVDLKKKFKCIFVILKSIENYDLERIDNISKYDNVVIAVMDKNIFLENKNIVMLKGLNEKINVEALIDMFSNKDIMMRVKNKKKISSMILGNEDLVNPVGNMLRNILKNFSHIDNYKEYIMYLYSNKEFNLQETAYLEDLMREYLYNAGKIEIKQIKDSEIEDNVFYSILATR